MHLVTLAPCARSGIGAPLYYAKSKRASYMGRGGAKFRTWSGPGGSSHKGPLTSALAYPRYLGPLWLEGQRNAVKGCGTESRPFHVTLLRAGRFPRGMRGCECIAVDMVGWSLAPQPFSLVIGNLYFVLIRHKGHHGNH